MKIGQFCCVIIICLTLKKCDWLIDCLNAKSACKEVLLSEAKPHMFMLGKYDLMKARIALQINQESYELTSSLVHWYLCHADDLIN